MSDWQKREKGLAILLFLFLVLGLSKYEAMYAESKAVHSKSKKSILVLSSGDGTSRETPEYLQGIWSILPEDTYRIYHEYLGITNQLDSLEYNTFYRYLKQKNAILDCDAVIVNGNHVLGFVRQYQKELYDGIPVIFTGVDHEYATEAAQNESMTGVIKDNAFHENIELAHKLCKTAKKVLFLVEGEAMYQEIEKSYQEIKGKYPYLQYSIHDVLTIPIEEFESFIAGLTKQTILTLVFWPMDGTKQYEELKLKLDLLISKSSIPIFKLPPAQLVEGLLGGYETSEYQCGQLAAEMVLEIFNGRQPKDLEIITNPPLQCRIDYHSVTKHHLDSSILPKESELIHRDMDAFQNRQNIVLPILVSTLSILFILGLFVHNIVIRRKLIKNITKSKK